MSLYRIGVVAACLMALTAQYPAAGPAGKPVPDLSGETRVARGGAQDEREVGTPVQVVMAMIPGVLLRARCPAADAVFPLHPHRRLFSLRLRPGERRNLGRLSAGNRQRLERSRRLCRRHRFHGLVHSQGTAAQRHLQVGCLWPVSQLSRRVGGYRRGSYRSKGMADEGLPQGGGPCPALRCPVSTMQGSALQRGWFW